MEGLLNVLKDLQNVIQKALINFKKSPKDRLTLEYIEAKLELLENDWSSFKDAKLKLFGSYKTEDIGQRVVDAYDITEEAYISCKCLMKTALNKLTTTGSLHTSANLISTPSSSFVRLPKITIPTFSGKYSEWTTFHDLFTSLVHKNGSLDNVQKMHYLKGHLTGEAEQLIRHTPVTEANYSQCWDLLQRRYANKKYLTNCILKRLFGLRRLTYESAALLKELLDTTNDCLRALQNLSIDISTWDVIIIHIVTLKLDPETHKHWELSTSSDSSNELPTLSQFKTFIETRFRALECIEPGKATVRQNQIYSSSAHNSRAMVATSSSDTSCALCSEAHKLCHCKQFAKQSVENRREFVSKNKLCFNCLGENHTFYKCNNNTSCRVCGKRHHTLLHPTEQYESRSQDDTSNPPIDNTSVPSGDDQIIACFSKVPNPKQVLLATALVNVESRMGNIQTVRALIDQGSQACFITEATVQFLRLKKIPVRGLVSGLGKESSTLVKHMVQLIIRSRVDSDFHVEVNAYVLSKITSYLPEQSINSSALNWVGLSSLCLADPMFHTSNKIDILLGADVYCFIVKEGVLKSPSGSLIAQNTTLGWLLSGVVGLTNENSRHQTKNIGVHQKGNHSYNKILGQVSLNSDSIHCHHHAFGDSPDHADSNALLRRFWEIESVTPTNKILSVEEQRCEDLYADTTYRDKEGRYVVNLPFREVNPQSQYGDSRSLAVKRFHFLERKFNRNPAIKARYSEAFNEYIELGHMQPVHVNECIKSTAVYLPHHAVVREDKTTTKVRIVFDASMKGSNGVSLNDDLMVGPVMQPPLRHIVMRWRMHPISLCADIVKMYRQVKVAPEHAEFQRVLWRDNTDSEIKEYRLMRVTFGTAAAPYLAVKSLQQVAVDEGHIYPDMAERIKNDFFVDDLMTGCHSIEEGLLLHQNLTEILSKGGFLLQKWVSSHNGLNSKFKEYADAEANSKGYEREDQKGKDIKLDTVMKILGLSWDRESDEFKYSVQFTIEQPPITKRKVISEISRLFDPLGWMAPCIVTFKIFIQKLWLSGLDWDEELTRELLLEWQTYRSNLAGTNKFSIPRWVRTGADDLLIELHGFCDASIAAYAAVIYVRVIDVHKTVHVGLVTSRTKVAPVKQQSIPRLELMGAVLLSELITEVAAVMRIPLTQTHAWTDSTVVLAWLSKHPSHWTTFVGNRISAILSCFDNSHWAHVESAHNPADIASRGVTPKELERNTLWIQGPLWLHENIIQYTRPRSIATNTEQRLIKSHIMTEGPQELPVWTRFSTLQKLVRVIAYCRRVLNWKRRVNGKPRYESYLTKEEIREATNVCIRYVQNQVYSEEIGDIKATGDVKSRSKLRSLCPFIDNEGILRVSGRVQNSNLDETVKHPIILPSDEHFTNLLIDDAHKKTLHGGPTLMLTYLRSRYWIVSAKLRVKAHVRKCVKCRRYSSSIRTPFMGQLPSCRVTPARPFRHTGVDFAGPIRLRTHKGRGYQSYKAYICVFICMVTKAIHLEAISDLTSQAFIAGFKRFVARRGIVTDIWSDNATNFVGASKELQHLVAAEKSSVALEIRNWMSDNNTTWHFIPPHSPNFGGLWEAGVKSTKFHLNRVIGSSTLTFEEMSTLLYQVEACLNSRPLSIISDNSINPSPLTPGHFLIGEPLMIVPDRNFENNNISSLRRWQVTQRMLQDFWQRWSNEYLVQLLHRYKWTKTTPEPNIGDVVLVKEDNLPPARWLLGKIIEKHPGADNITRVVTLRCNRSLMKRPVSKLCILPVAT